MLAALKLLTSTPSLMLLTIPFALHLMQAGPSGSPLAGLPVPSPVQMMQGMGQAEFGAFQSLAGGHGGGASFVIGHGPIFLPADAE